MGSRMNAIVASARSPSHQIHSIGQTPQNFAEQYGITQAIRIKVNRKNTAYLAFSQSVAKSSTQNQCARASCIWHQRTVSTSHKRGVGSYRSLSSSSY